MIDVILEEQENMPEGAGVVNRLTLPEIIELQQKPQSNAGIIYAALQTGHPVDKETLQLGLTSTENKGDDDKRWAEEVAKELWIVFKNKVPQRLQQAIYNPNSSTH